MGSYSINTNMAVDITSPIDTTSITTHSLDDIRRLQAALQQKSFKSSAPTANMMSSTSPTTTTAHSPFSMSRPSTSYQTSPPSSSHGSISGGNSNTFAITSGGATIPTAPRGRNRSDSMKTIAKYPFLSECAAQRPAVYQSPYSPGPSLGITEPWLPSPPMTPKSEGGVIGVLRSRSGSLAQDFLKKQSASQRERMQGHVRTISTEKAMLQQQEAERRRYEHQERRRRRSSKLGLYSPLADAFSLRSFTNSPGFSDFGPSYASNDFSSILQSDLGYGLQFPGSNDFQAQLQREADMQAKPTLMTHEKNSYRAFVRDLQSGNGVNGNAMDFIHTGDTSPLRRGMTTGTEMLPMMQDPNHPF